MSGLHRYLCECERDLHKKTSCHWGSGEGLVRRHFDSLEYLALTQTLRLRNQFGDACICCLNCPCCCPPLQMHIHILHIAWADPASPIQSTFGWTRHSRRTQWRSSPTAFLEQVNKYAVTRISNGHWTLALQRERKNCHKHMNKHITVLVMCFFFNYTNQKH